MSVEEARRVTWLRSRPKPLGELLDEGYLTKARLEWAAQWAYNARLKEAARVILEWQSRRAAVADRPPREPVESAEVPAKAIPIGIRLEDARATPWPFAPFRGQAMGELSAGRQISLKDLAWAVESAWDDRVRRSAVALLLERLDQGLQEPPPPAGPLNVVTAGRSFADASQLRLTFIQGTLLGALLGACLVGIVTCLLRPHPATDAAGLWARATASMESLIAFGLAVGFVICLILLSWLGPNWILKKLDQQIEAYRRGEEGEERVIERTRQALDGHWTLFRNVMLPGRRGDLDLVLVGPPGVWSLEVKALRGQYRNQGDAWEYQRRSRWRRTAKSPSAQARKGAAALRRILEADGIKTYVNTAIAWAGEEGNLSVEDPSVAVWTIDRLEDELGNLWNGHWLEETDRQRIVEELTRLCQRRRNGPW